MIPRTVTIGPIAAGSASYYVTSVTPASGATLTLAHSTTPDLPRRLSVAYGTEGSARTLTVTGKMIANGPTVTEVIAIPSGGAGSPVQSALDYYSITSVVAGGGAFSAAITIGTNGVMSSTWISIDSDGYAPVNFQADVSGTANYTVEGTLEDPNDPVLGLGPAGVIWGTIVTAASASAVAGYAYPLKMARFTLNSGTGSVRCTVIQSNTPGGLR